MELRILVVSGFEPYIQNLRSGDVSFTSGYTTSVTTVGGVTATMLSRPENPTTSNERIIYLEKDNEWFLFFLRPDQKNIRESYALLDKIIATFAFTAKEGNNPPAEYSLLKDISDWELSYQVKNNDYNALNLVCADGRKGNTSKDYLFSMGTHGDTQGRTNPGDIDIPFAKVVSTLKNNGWTDCGIPTEKQDPTNGNKYVFIKNNKLIGINKYYSMGTGNGLGVLIQYDK